MELSSDGALLVKAFPDEMASDPSSKGQVPGCLGHQSRPAIWRDEKCSQDGCLKRYSKGMHSLAISTRCSRRRE